MYACYTEVSLAAPVSLWTLFRKHVNCSTKVWLLQEFPSCWWRAGPRLLSLSSRCLSSSQSEPLHFRSIKHYTYRFQCVFNGKTLCNFFIFYRHGVKCNKKQFACPDKRIYAFRLFNLTVYVYFAWTVYTGIKIDAQQQRF